MSQMIVATHDSKKCTLDKKKYIVIIGYSPADVQDKRIIIKIHSNSFNILYK